MSGKKADIRFYAGKTGTGKSWFAGYEVEQLLNEGKYVVVFDPHNEHGFGQKYPFAKLVVGEETLKRLDRKKAFEILKHYQQQGKNLRIVTNKLYIDQYMQLIDYFSWAILELHNIVFFIDECKDVAPNEQGAPIELKKLVTEGRKFGCDIIMVAQRPAMIDTTLISQANSYYIFQMTDINDLQRIRGYVNDVEIIKNLKNREYVYVDTDKNTEQKLTTNGLHRATKHRG
jgi:DNA helicase HerA-like ATPase